MRNERMRLLAELAKADPFDDITTEIVCAGMHALVRRALVRRIERARPGYRAEQCEAFLKTVFEESFSQVLLDIDEERVNLASLADPCRYVLRTTLRVFGECLDAAHPGELGTLLRWHELRETEGFRRALRDLDAEPRRLLHLKVRLGMQVQDIAVLLGMDVITVQSRLEEAVEELRNIEARSED